MITLSRIERKKKKKKVCPSCRTHFHCIELCRHSLADSSTSSNLSPPFFPIPPHHHPAYMIQGSPNSLLTDEPKHQSLGTLAYLEYSSTYNFAVGTNGAQFRETMGHSRNRRCQQSGPYTSDFYGESVTWKCVPRN